MECINDFYISIILILTTLLSIIINVDMCSSLMNYFITRNFETVVKNLDDTQDAYSDAFCRIPSWSRSASEPVDGLTPKKRRHRLPETCPRRRAVPTATPSEHVVCHVLWRRRDASVEVSRLLAEADTKGGPEGGYLGNHPQGIFDKHLIMYIVP